MSSIESMVSATLEKNGHSELTETWLKICALYGEGGPELLDSTYSEKIKEIRSKFTELRQIQSEKPMVKSQKRRLEGGADSLCVYAIKEIVIEGAPFT